MKNQNAVARIAMPKLFTISLAGGDTFIMRALGPEDARALFDDCHIPGSALARVEETRGPRFGA